MKAEGRRLAALRREILSQLTEGVRRAVEVGDWEAARVLNEAIGRLLWEV